MNSACDLPLSLNPAYQEDFPEADVFAGQDIASAMDFNGVVHGVFFWYNYKREHDTWEIFDISWTFMVPDINIENFPKNEIKDAFWDIAADKFGNPIIEDEMTQRKRE